MILYNVTVNIDDDVREEWITWMKTKHIPDVLATGQFIDHRFYKLIEEVQNGGTTYSIQFFARSMREIDHYLANFATRLRDDHLQKFKDKHVAFRTVLESVD
ncbi:DUF4286 family protein [Fulvivirgaceae bacterium BMA12]|uniref:DUF4286 family protein n=1 Tax=Agaribacillus aureus TaxID=3051825 RepID=A0ABT8L8R8_9BACT|nr:DUF4286 family protein [Fulvivirgaceae bacterium BMA12]